MPDVPDPDFYKTKALEELSDAEWEALCDGCGRCCYRPFISGRGKKRRLHFTRIACNLLDLDSGRCTAYSRRFEKQPDCSRLTPRNVGKCDWLPETCAYRCLYYKRPLPDWHPLVSDSSDSVQKAGVRIQGGVHECDVDIADWEDYELGPEEE